MDKVDLKSLSEDELVGFLAEMGEKPFRVGQIRKWLYKFGVTGFEAMTDLSRSLRERLAERARISKLSCVEVAESEDGARKLLWDLEDGHAVESVLIPERNHFTLCVSSQVGCAMGCRFCRTAEMGLIRNLTAPEIINQVLGAKNYLPDGASLTNLVFMGMGEPLANRENVVRAIETITESGLAGMSRKHISVSTVGLVPQFPDLAKMSNIGLTVSLNAADDETRNRLMPVNRKYDMARLHKALSEYPMPKRRRITIAYVLLAGVNDRVEDAVKLTKYLHGLKVKVNLIPFNPYPGSEFGRPTEEAIDAFLDVLVKNHYTAMVRRSKGRGVAGACGQLAGERAPGGAAGECRE